VLVKQGRIVGEGFHLAAGRPHAEVEALNRAGTEARGSTAYVTLEPCAHFGRTPPCCNALIDAGIARVVAGVVDPNPAVSGRGIAALKAAGIEVSVGVAEAECRRLNEAFFHFHATHRPFVTLKSAVSLDGKIAANSGDSKWITGERARRHAHFLRARSGAVLCGIGTVLKDDPLLTARLPRLPRQPIRIVLDSGLRIPVDSQLVRTAKEVPTWIAAADTLASSRVSNLESLGVEILRVPADTRGWIDLELLLELIGKRGITSLLVEGGGEVHASFLKANLVHRLLWCVAPKIIGGAAAPTSVEGAGIEAVSDSRALSPFVIKRLGDDLLLESSPVIEEKKQV